MHSGCLKWYIQELVDFDWLYTKENFKRLPIMSKWCIAQPDTTGLQLLLWIARLMRWRYLILYSPLWQRDYIEIIHDYYQRNTGKLTITMSRCQKQTGNKDCGLFAIAFAVALVFNLNASQLKFRQEVMRAHLVDCFEKEIMTPFPCKR